MLLTFWLVNLLGATVVCYFRQFWQKVVRTPNFFDILTCKCASRYSGVNVQKCSAPGVFCTFWLANALRATAACHFPHPNFQKCSDGEVFCTVQFYLKCASRHSGVQFFLSALSSYLRTRRFSEPTFRPSRPTHHWKNTAIRDLPNISRVWIFFRLTFVQLYLLSSDSTSLLCFSSSDSASLLCFFNCPYCRKLDF